MAPIVIQANCGPLTSFETLTLLRKHFHRTRSSRGITIPHGYSDFCERFQSGMSCTVTHFTPESLRRTLDICLEHNLPLDKTRAILDIGIPLSFVELNVALGVDFCEQHFTEETEAAFLEALTEANPRAVRARARMLSDYQEEVEEADDSVQEDVELQLDAAIDAGLPETKGDGWQSVIG